MALEAATHTSYERISARQMEEVTELTLPHEHILNFFEEDFHRLPALKSLVIRSIFHRQGTRKALCAGNLDCEFTLPDKIFSGLTSLEHLSLHANQFDTLPDGVFDGLEKLEILDLRQLSVPVLPSSLSRLPAIKTIFVSRGPVQDYRGGLGTKEIDKLRTWCGEEVIHVYKA